jgi:hypothetical protein
LQRRMNLHRKSWLSPPRRFTLTQHLTSAVFLRHLSI